MKLFHSIKIGLSDIYYIWRREYRAVFHDLGIVLFFFALPFAYPIVYAAVYNPEVVREVPMVVVDNARTPLSRELAREMDATPNAHIVSYCADMDEAKDMMYEKHCYGILFIPEDFSRKIERGEQSVVSFYSDMSILLNYKGFLIALTDVTMNLGGKLQTQALGGATQEQINVATQPIPYSSINLYNPESGLGSFFLPAIFVLILQQSLIFGICMMAGGIYEHRQLHLFYSGREHMHNNVLHLVIGKSLCYFSLYILCTAYILHFIPWLFKYPQIGSQVEIYSFAVPFLLSSIFFGMTLSIFVRERESSFLLFVFTSVIFLFISGITWPRYAMPEYWKWLGALIPSTWGIEGFVRMNTAGAGIYDVRHAYTMLWILTGVYFVTTCLVYRYQIWKDKKRGFSGVLDSGVD